jgi:hypothetical protein
MGAFDDLIPKKQQGGAFADLIPATPKKESSILGDIAAGAVRGAGSIGATILYPWDKVQDLYYGDRTPSVTGLVTGKQPLSRNEERRLAMDEGLRELGADTDSIAFKGGKLASEIAGTAGAGGLIAKGLRAIPGVAAAAPRLISAIETGGFVTGGPATATIAGRAADLGIRSVGGGTTGAASAGLIDPDSALAGAAIGAVLPPAVLGVGRAGDYAANAVSSLVKPFTANGQQEIAGNVLRRFADGGPTAVNAAQVVPGSVPTLAEATGNAGLATLQRGIRDVRPNAFIEREAQNAAARSALFDEVAGDADKLAFFKADRKTVAKELYDAALDQANQQSLTPWIKGQITQLNKAPTIIEARKEAQRLARDRLEKPSPDGSLRALQDMKTIIDDKISKAVREGKGGEAEALGDLQSKLTNVMEKLSLTYAEANATYAAMSKPINAMEALQGMKLTDARGNITLAKVKSAIESLEKQRAAPGFNAAKSVTDEQLSALRSIHEDLLRQDNLGLGRPIGSNTFQNIATDNILNSVAGSTLSRLADRLGVAGAVGQVGRLAYSGPNEAIRNRIADLMLSPQMAEPLLQPQLGAPNALSRFLTDPRVQQPLYRIGPVLATDQ